MADPCGLDDDPTWVARLSPSGEDLGRIREVMGDQELDVFSGVLVENGLLHGTEYGSAEQLAAIHEGGVTLAR
jgi:hypothetical protein